MAKVSKKVEHDTKSIEVPILSSDENGLPSIFETSSAFSNGKQFRQQPKDANRTRADSIELYSNTFVVKSHSSPLVQAVLKRDNTEKTRTTISRAKTVLNKDTGTISQLLQPEREGTLRDTVLGVWDLLKQWQILFFGVYYLILTVVMRSSKITMKGSFGYVDILGWIVGLLVAFRQNQAMLRFWEARTAWGELVVVSRNLCRAGVSFIREKEKATIFGLYVVAFSVSMKLHLRSYKNITDEEKELKLLLSNEDSEFVLREKVSDRPVAILDLIEALVVRGRNDGLIDTEAVFFTIEPLIQQLSEKLGTTNRIKTTPIPKMYQAVLDLVLFTFLLALPFSLISRGWNHFVVLMVSMLVNMVLYGLTKLGVQLEDPFGTDMNDLPLGTYTADIMSETMAILDRWYKPLSVLPGAHHSDRNRPKKVTSEMDSVASFNLKSKAANAESVEIPSFGFNATKLAPLPIPVTRESPI